MNVTRLVGGTCIDDLVVKTHDATGSAVIVEDCVLGIVALSRRCTLSLNGTENIPYPPTLYTYTLYDLQANQARAVSLVKNMTAVQWYHISDAVGIPIW